MDTTQRIKEKTGLTTNEDVSFYWDFVRSVNRSYNLFSPDETKHNIYETLRQKASRKELALEKQLSEDFGNHNLSWEEYNQKSPLSQKTQTTYDHYFQRFKELGLISALEFQIGKNTDYMFIGYNIFNDKEVYEAHETAYSSSRTLIET